MKKLCRRCKKLVLVAKSATKYCEECAIIVSKENRRKTGRLYYHRKIDSCKCNKCGELIQPNKHLCSNCKKKKVSVKRLKEQIVAIEQQLLLYKKMFKAQDDMISEKDDKIKELKEENKRLTQNISWYNKEGGR